MENIQFMWPLLPAHLLQVFLITCFLVAIHILAPLWNHMTKPQTTGLYSSCDF